LFKRVGPKIWAPERVRASPPGISRKSKALSESKPVLAPIARPRRLSVRLQTPDPCVKSRPMPAFGPLDDRPRHSFSKETRFFREREKPWQRVLKNVLPEAPQGDEMNRARSKSGWRVGSTGQEAYSLAILLRDELPPACGGCQGIEKSCRQISAKVTTENARMGATVHYEVQKGLSIHRLNQALSKPTRRPSVGRRVRRFGPISVSGQHNPARKRCRPWQSSNVIICRNVACRDGAFPARVRVVLKALASQLGAGRPLVLLGQGEGLNWPDQQARARPRLPAVPGWAAGTANAAKRPAGLNPHKTDASRKVAKMHMNALYEVRSPR